MARCLSIDLRERVVAAVDGGMSRRRAAERFGVSVASAIRWASLSRRTGDVRPKPQGGDKRSHRIEAQASLILEVVETRRDITLEELRAHLAGQGVAVAASTLCRFFKRHAITLKKRPGMRPSRTVPTS
jgi:transposase